MIILGLDISSRKTGWAVLKNGRFYKREDIDFGTIETNNKNNTSERLCIFRDVLEKVLLLVKPDMIVIEDAFFLKNVSTLKLLIRFCGIAQELSQRLLKIDPIIVPVKKARNVIGSQDKNEVFNIVKNKYKLTDFTFSNHNDITDAIVLTLHGNSLKDEE